MRLVFLGMRHPNADVPEMRMAVEARRLADELGLTGVHVFFNEEWVPYDDRQNYLLDADVAVTTHLHHVETDFSFRTRVLDYLWAGLPTVATNGDSLADLIEREGLGRDGAARATSTPSTRRCSGCWRTRRSRPTAGPTSPRCGRGSRGRSALRPVVEFCRRPVRSPDLASGYIDSGGFVAEEHGRESAWVRYKRAVLNLVREGEWGVMASSAVRVGRRLARRALPRSGS